jgi:hypothetical protein
MGFRSGPRAAVAQDLRLIYASHLSIHALLKYEHEVEMLQMLVPWRHFQRTSFPTHFRSAMQSQTQVSKIKYVLVEVSRRPH